MRHAQELTRTGKLLFPALLVCLAGATPGHAQEAASGKQGKYPLRLHILAVDDTYRTVRMQPNWCSAVPPDFSGGGAAGGTGGGADPCSNGGGSLSFGGEDDFSGSGRADLVSPPLGTAAVNFRYDGCSRVRVFPGFRGLPARWKKAGKKLEVLLPTDALSGNHPAVPVEKCTLTAEVHDYVYLRLGSGAMVKVSQEAYRGKPALRAFLSGGPQTLLQRNPPIVSVKELAAPRPQ